MTPRGGESSPDIGMSPGSASGVSPYSIAYSPQGAKDFGESSPAEPEQEAYKPYSPSQQFVIDDGMAVIVSP